MLALVCALGLVSSTPWASAATVAEIAKNPAAFDQKTVTVSGTAGEVSSRTSRRGNPYTTFRLSDQGEAIKVFSFGTLPIKEGDRVEVRGVFQRVKQVGAYTFHDEIDASSVSAAK
jgi:cytochrome c-type biogenesis protein CcmE